MTDSTRPVAGLQIRADYLCEGDALGRAPGFPGAEAASLDVGGLESAPRRGSWRSRDVQRALAAARKAGIERYRVEISPDGTIAIIVGFE